MKESIAPAKLHDKIIIGAALFGLFFGLMPPYVLTIVVVATWGVPPLEAAGRTDLPRRLFSTDGIGECPQLDRRRVSCRRCRKPWLTSGRSGNLCQRRHWRRHFGRPRRFHFGRCRTIDVADQFIGSELGKDHDSASVPGRRADGHSEWDRGRIGDRVLHSPLLEVQ